MSRIFEKEDEDNVRIKMGDKHQKLNNQVRDRKAVKQAREEGNFTDRQQQVLLVAGGSPISVGSSSKAVAVAAAAAGVTVPIDSSSTTTCCLNNINPSEAAAANAMVIVARLILVILICVLLVKLRAPKGSRRKWAVVGGGGIGSKKRVEGDDEDDSQLIYDEYKQKIQFSSQTIYDHDQQQQIYNSNSYNNEFNNLSQGQQTTYDFRNLNNLQKQCNTSNNTSHQQQQQQYKRKLSQPELGSKSKQQESSEQNIAERRRRHSDTSLAHLKLPPGPMGLPFLGYLPFISNEIHLTLTSLSEKYGPIYQIFLGGIRVVVLNDASLVRQAFKQPVFSGRPDTQLTQILQGYGIVNSEGALWKEQRAFLHSALRKLGAKSLMNGSNGLEAKIQVSFSSYHHPPHPQPPPPS